MASSSQQSQGVVLPDRIVPMRVIVCGVHRTGTLSTLSLVRPLTEEGPASTQSPAKTQRHLGSAGIRNALWQLGFHDCYHMHTLIRDPSRAPEWVRAFEAKYAGQGSFTRADWDRLLGDCQAVCDVPAAFFGAELAEVYPEAKVIILNRDPEKWYDSVLNSIYTMTKPKGFLTKLSMFYSFLFDTHLQNMMRYSIALRKWVQRYDHGEDKDKALAWYKSQYEEFRERIPQERRIDYTITDGWAPLFKGDEEEEQSEGEQQPPIGGGEAGADQCCGLFDSVLTGLQRIRASLDEESCDVFTLGKVCGEAG
ncbi:hypothetical protein FALBO_6212 [Fusarium albosuccineum]|uniref:P-loop containing nucleoside triphosphate hydrolase protein n=1 Tax=Fusarium albosuccineum TaxID=1237068 RepID=A0A8H4LCI9_9HYPO|nr:hypothetical protein FALBO_6212 [Fusarium albosuccineum]